MEVTKRGSSAFSIFPFCCANTQDERRVVPQKEGLRRSTGSFEGSRHLHPARRLFLPFRNTQIDDVRYRSILVERYDETDILDREAERWGFG